MSFSTDFSFPTLRRLFDIRPWHAVLRPWRTTWAQRRSLMRWIVTATEEDIPLSQLVEVWADDESGRQSDRLRHLAALLRSGTPLPDAIEEVPSLLGEEDVLAIRFGMQSGTLAATIRDRLDERDPGLDYGSSRLRKSAVYLCIVTVFACAIVTFLMIRIVPSLRRIFDEFEISTPASLQWSVYLAGIVTDYWYLFVLAMIAVWLLLFSSRPGRQLRLRFFGWLFQPLRELRMADVLQKLSVATQAGRPIAGALSTLARYHFDPALRHQLLVVRNELEHGADVWPSMGKLGLLSGPEVRVLESAERVGNRPWVLRQVAQVKKRRIGRRFAHWSELALPIIVIALGAFVLLQALSVFESLLNIVSSLL
jgi:type IV pilus assembly protein PilC